MYYPNYYYVINKKYCSTSIALLLHPGGFVILDFGGGSEESSTDDDGGVGGDVGIDMRKLLSSSSQAGSGCGPNLSRQLMTHLRLLQADLQYLKVLHTQLTACFNCFYTLTALWRVTNPTRGGRNPG